MATARRRRLLLAVVLIGTLSGGIPASAQSLTEALAFAYQSNPQLLAQRALLRATDEGVPQALANWRPTVVFNGTTGFENSAIAETHHSTIYTNTRPSSLDLTLTQPVYRGGRTEAQTRQALDTVEATRAQTLAVETSVFQAVAQAYLDVVRDQDLVEVNRQNEQVLRDQLAATEHRFRLGEVTQTDVAQAEASLGQAGAALAAAEGQLEASQVNYARAVGKPPGRLLAPRERPALPATREAAVSLAANNNPNVIAANFAELAARDNIDVVRGQLLPQVSIIGDFNRAYDISGIRNVWQTTGVVAARMTMPLYEAGAVYSQTRQAEQTVGQRRGQVDDARRAAMQSAGQNWAILRAARIEIARLSTAVQAAQIALQGMQAEALFGARTVLDVLISQQQVLATQSQLITARHDAALAEFNIAAATGRLIAAELKLPVPLYDMDRHEKKVKNKWIGLGGGLSE